MRIQQYLSRASIASRRKCETLIKNGYVKINDIVVTEPWVKVKDGDIVKFKNKIIKEESFVYLAFNKPINVLSSASDDRGRKTIIDYYKGNKRVYPVGRLDYISKGLIIVTNDGDFANKITHPRYEHKKYYDVKLDRHLNNAELNLLNSPIKIDGEYIKASSVKLKDNLIYEFILSEGKNRQIRKMVKQTRAKILELKRTRIANIFLGNLEEGKFRNISKSEISDFIKKV